MTFRNPITSLNTVSGDDITPGTITGSTLQTAQSGQRIVISNAQQIESFSGANGETAPGGLYSIFQAGTGDGGFADPTADYENLFLTSPRIGPSMASTQQSTITLASGPRDGSAPGAVYLNNCLLVSGDISGNNIYGGEFYSGPNPLTGSQIKKVAGYTVTTVVVTIPGTRITFPEGRWLVTAKGYCDWSVGSGSPKYTIDLRGDYNGAVQDSAVVNGGALIGTIPFVTQTIIDSAGNYTVSLSAKYSGSTGGVVIMTRIVLTVVPAP